MRKPIYFWIIFVFAVVLRLTLLSYTPPSLNWDEVSHGYNAYSILKTGRDEWGKKLPSIFRAYGDYKLPAYVYLLTPFVAAFGLNEFSVRLLSALAGIGTVIFTYLLTKKFFGEKVGLLAMFLIALEPWSFFLSRGAFEANLALFFFTAGVYFWHLSLHTTYYILPATILLGLTVWTYNSYRVFTPLMVLVFAFLYYKKNFKLLTSHFILLALFLLPMFVQLFSSSGLARYKKVSIINEGAVAGIIEKRQTAKMPPPLARLIYNRPLYFAKEFIGNYLEYFSPKFLFFEGGTQYQFSVPKTGLLYLINLPFFYLGLAFLLKKEYRLFLFWLLLAPIPASLTNEKYAVIRATTMLPATEIVTALGFFKFINWVIKNSLKIDNWKLKIAIRVYIGVILFSLGKYLSNYFTEYRTNYSWSWQYGYKEAVSFAKANYDKYDKIIITKKYGEPHEFFLFFWPWDPAKYQSDPEAIRFHQSEWWWVDRFDKFYFVNDWEVREMKLESGGSVRCLAASDRCLLITSPGNHPAGWSKIGEINFLDGKPAFEIYENK